ncbi:DUF1289 domain-containing protein [Maricaulis maris]|uniref:DUF1289 domain-containing protein n=1 Tax=Maricaulis maris TaxID=74318 RepID=UPI00147674F7|nr:DUF1289 domain-containing protein [Maricaulis maris]
MTQMPVPTPIKTPCVQVCFVDPKAQLCVGCFRTLEELGRWTRYSDDEREAVMAALPQREAAYAAARKTARD